MIDYWLRMGLLIYGMSLFLVLYRDYREDCPMEQAVFFGALGSFCSSLLIFTIYFLLNLFVGV